MSFGIDAGISRQTNCSTNVAEQLDENGDIADMTTYGGRSEVTEETYSDSFTNEALPGQSGTSSIVTAHNYIESNTEYAREQKTTVAALAPASA